MALKIVYYTIIVHFTIDVAKQKPLSTFSVIAQPKHFGSYNINENSIKNHSPNTVLEYLN